MLYLLPEWFLRLMLFFLTHTIYRIKVIGRDNIPEKGGALLVSNHMSFVDVLLLMASTDRPIRFLMFKAIYDNPIMKPFARMMKAIPISSELRPRDMIRSLRTASDAIRDGETVCIFAEGQITRTGQMFPFRRGMERIIKGVESPIIPVNLHGVWGSIFSFERGRFLWKIPRRIPYPVTVSFGKVPAATQRRRGPPRRPGTPEPKPFATATPMRTLDRAFVRTARRYLCASPWRMRVNPKVRFVCALAETDLRRAPSWPRDGRSADGRIAAAALCRRRARQLCAHTARPRTRQSQLHRLERGDRFLRTAMQSETTVITSKAFVERFPKIEIPGRTIFLKTSLNPRASQRGFLRYCSHGSMPLPFCSRHIGAAPGKR